MAAKMLIIGSSNIRRIFKPRLESFSKQLGVNAQYVSATQFEAGCDALEWLEPGQRALVGFLMNGLVEEMEQVEEKDLEQEMKKFVLKYAELLKGADRECKMVVLPPYPRGRMEWTVKLLGEIHDTLRVSLAGAPNIRVLNYCNVEVGEFEADGIHLTPDCQAKQFAHIVKELLEDAKPTPRKRQHEWSEESTSAAKRSAGNSDSTGEMSTAASTFRGRGGRVIGRTRGRGGRGGFKSYERPNNDSEQGEQEDKMNIIEGRLSRLAYEMMCNWETTDTAINKLNLNVLVIDQIPKTELIEAKDVAAKLVMSTEVDISSLATAFFLPGQNDETVYPRLRIVFRNNDSAFQFRMAALRERKEGKEPWKAMFVTNDATKATRVRIEILKRIGDAIKDESIAKDQDIFVNKFDAKPMLIFKKDRKVTRRIPYPEAVKRWGGKLNRSDLALAKKIAGRELADRFDSMFGV